MFQIYSVWENMINLLGVIGFALAFSNCAHVLLYLCFVAIACLLLNFVLNMLCVSSDQVRFKRSQTCVTMPHNMCVCSLSGACSSVLIIGLCINCLFFVIIHIDGWTVTFLFWFFPYFHFRDFKIWIYHKSFFLMMKFLFRSKSIISHQFWIQLVHNRCASVVGLN